VAPPFLGELCLDQSLVVPTVVVLDVASVKNDLLDADVGKF
jgi:hypothetical protein